MTDFPFPLSAWSHFAAFVPGMDGIWGLGHDQESCLTDARSNWGEYADQPKPDFKILPCTFRLYLEVEVDGGDIDFRRRKDGVLDSSNVSRLADWVDSRKGILEKLVWIPEEENNCHWCGGEKGNPRVQHRPECEFSKAWSLLEKLAEARRERTDR